MIAALAKGAGVLDEPTYARAAEKAAGFILERLRDEDGRLLHRYRDGEAGIKANVDDYSFMIWGLLELYETTFKSEWLRHALILNDQMVTHFWDESHGGFYFTPDDGEKLLVRTKEIYDGAAPSGNSVAMLNMMRLARMTGDTAYENKAEDIGRAFSSTVVPAPMAFTQLMSAVDFAVGPTFEVVIAGGRDSDDTRLMLQALRQTYLPDTVVLFRPVDNEKDDIIQMVSYLKDMKEVNGKSAAYVCVDFACSRPTTDGSEMLRLLGR